MTNLDRNMTKPPVEAAGLKCVRADEIVHSGLIDLPMYEQLLNADVVVTDLSTSIRTRSMSSACGTPYARTPRSSSPKTGLKTFPFDVNHVLVPTYHHLGEDIGFGEVKRFRQELTKALVEIMQKEPRAKESPVYTFLNGLNPPRHHAAMRAEKGRRIPMTIVVHQAGGCDAGDGGSFTAS